jgi:hypothetical protein
MANYILNTPILTAFGKWDFSPMSIDEAKAFANEADFVSAVGHQATADLLTQILGTDVPCLRQAVTLEKGDKALVFRLMRRLPEGVVLGAKDLAAEDFSFGMLERLE